MTITGADPFLVLAYQNGQIGAPLTAEAAAGADALDTQQRGITIGEPVPVVFCRRVGTTGGVLVSPGAAEARFENSATNEVTASYRLVISEGQIDGVQIRDVFQRSCRVGTFSQAYGRRAGNWLPGNFIVERAGYDKPECPYYCGTGGTYEDITTGSFQITVPDGFDQWNRQVHLFVRGGMYVVRLVDGLTGPSNNVVDLIQWIVQRSRRMPAAMIDTARLTAAARFVQAMGFQFDGVLEDASNIEDFIAAHAPYFLLTKTRRGGRFGLSPVLPVTDDDVLDTGPIEPRFVFDESMIEPDSIEVSYVPLSERKPVCLLMLWRQQPEDDIGLIRTTEVRYAGTAGSGPYEQHDLSAFATSELHIVRAGAYIVARRRHVTHTLRVKVRPGEFNATLAKRDIVQVQFTRRVSSGAAAVHSYFYEVDSITRSSNGGITLHLTHFPVNEDLQSLVAIDVMSATASGVLFPTGKASAITCDVNSSTDTRVPAEDSLDPIDWNDTPYADGLEVADAGTGSGSGGFGGGGTGGGGRGTWGGRADGGADGSPGDSPDPDVPPPPGTPPPPAPPDKQTPPPDVTVPPPGVPPGGSAPADWVDQYNRSNTNSPDTPWPTDWGATPGGRWSLVYRLSWQLMGINEIGGGSFINPGSTDYTLEADTIGYVFGGFLSNAIPGRLEVYNPYIIFGNPFSGTEWNPGSRLFVWFGTARPPFISWMAYPQPPILTLISATRTA